MTIYQIYIVKINKVVELRAGKKGRGQKFSKREGMVGVVGGGGRGCWRKMIALYLPHYADPFICLVTTSGVFTAWKRRPTSAIKLKRAATHKNPPLIWTIFAFSREKYGLFPPNFHIFPPKSAPFPAKKCTFSRQNFTFFPPKDFACAQNWSDFRLQSWRERHAARRLVRKVIVSKQKSFSARKGGGGMDWKYYFFIGKHSSGPRDC
jgi:hypothetical protein